MEYNIISTGSQGNAVIINKTILIDCGVSFRALTDVYKSIKIVLLTHIHSDHFRKSTITKLAEERPSLRFACGVWLLNNLLDCGVSRNMIDVLMFNTKYDYKKFQLCPVKLYHNVQNCGYRVYMNNERLFYATDTNTLEGITAKDYDLYMVEANYTDEDIRERIIRKQQQGEYVYEYDVLKNHLSKEKCDNFIYSNIGVNGQYVYLHEHTERGITNDNDGKSSGI